MNRVRGGILLAAGMGVVLTGCATYRQTKERLDTGYYEDLKLEAERDRELAEDEQVALQRDLDMLEEEQELIVRQEADLQRQLAAIDADLTTASRDLERAREENRVGRSEYDELKAEIERLRLEQQKQSFVAGDGAEKQRQVEELRRKKEAVQRAIQALGAS